MTILKSTANDLWGRLTTWLQHNCISAAINLTHVHRLSSLVQIKAITSTNADLFSIGHLRTHFNEILFEIQTFLFEKMDSKLLTSKHYNEAMMSPMASQITSLMIIYSIAYSGADQRKHQSSASLAFVRGIHRCHLMTSSWNNVHFVQALVC